MRLKHNTQNKRRLSYALNRTVFLSLTALLISVPVHQASATSSIQTSVNNYCQGVDGSTPAPSCSSCHTSSNYSRNDLNALGQQAQTGNYSTICPATTPPPTTGGGGGTTTPPSTGGGGSSGGSTPPSTGGGSGSTPTPPTGGGGGMSPTTPPTTGMGRGRGGDDDELDDDDGGSRSGGFRSRFSRSSSFSRRGDD